MRVRVTGADGFVGRHLCAVFRRHGDEVFEVRGPSEVEDAPGIWSLDLLNGEGLARAVAASKPGWVVHLAGASSVAESHASPAKTFTVNAVGTVNVLDAIRTKAPDARVLVIGSGEVYGPVPFGERASEDSPLVPTSPYAASKASAELAGFQFHRSYGVAAICARSFNHLGAGQAPHFVVPSFARQLTATERYASQTIAVGNLEPVRDFSHVLDVVDAYRILLERGAPGDAYNVCSGVGRSIQNILDELVTLSGVEATITVDPARFRPAEIPSLVGDPTKLRSLGWTPKRTTTEALQEALEEARS
jgi:GDP-4-dehydro-6-deoxy-D-mannose reductase